MKDLIDVPNFLLATRDTGYRSTAQVIAEFVDNAIQARARRVRVEVSPHSDSRYPLQISVIDDGTGMDAETLAHALTFGGSSRFNDRSSLGRYGMGLPNGALSRAQRVELYSWQGQDVLRCSLDIDAVAAASSGWMHGPEVVECAPFPLSTPTGTAVRLLRCDRVEYKRAFALARSLEADLGRIYRHFLQGGFELSVNGRSVKAVDPLFLQPESMLCGARMFGDVLTYRIETAAGCGQISVRFSELPVERWHNLAAAQKREMGVTKAPCMSVVRACREIDRGWFFMGSKRRENYDDWWRCEISFEPVLDELFGITHAKQAITPSNELLDILAPDLEPIARALNSRVRRQFELVKATSALSAAESQAARADSALPPIPRRKYRVPATLREVVESAGTDGREVPYKIIVAELPSTSAFEVLGRRGQLVMLLNPRHPLYRDLYGPLAMSESARDQQLAKQVALAILAAARAEVGSPSRAGRAQAEHFRQTWADVLATFLNA